MGSRATRVTIYILLFCIIYISLNSIAHALNPNWFIWFEEDREEAKWLASSSSWWDRKACRWLSLCGLAHYTKASTLYGFKLLDTASPVNDDSAKGRFRAKLDYATGSTPNSFEGNARRLKEIPSYVFDYAPLVHLYSKEQYWPSDIGEHLSHTTPFLNYTAVPPEFQITSLNNLEDLNQWEKGRFVFLTSDSNVENRPDWIEGSHNIPEPGEISDEDDWFPGVFDSTCNNDAFDNPDEAPYPPDSDTDDYSEMNESPLSPTFQNLQRRAQQQLRPPKRAPGRSSAPVALIVVDKGDGIVDAFWFYFYSFNLGNVVLRIRFGNHMGDWEHSLVRFHHGKPKSIFFSAHSAGEAYSYEAVEKIGKRLTEIEPVIYSASGTHAMYATPGIHTYGLPWGLLHDVTDRGPLWDPALNAYTYTYNVSSDELRASTSTPDAPLSWFYFSGHWGDKFFPLNDTRQYRFGGQYHYVNGPLGPRFKHLGRSESKLDNKQAGPVVETSGAYSQGRLHLDL
ncbi:Vacuolar protein sorting-associated protein 62 [Ascosphaera pollenicola]|nr:Vacuolar protein sorting-associated protein 62 [Ascosphaera pollenicola]